MKLYHGTSSRFLDKVLKKGLTPRGRRKGNWSHTIEGHPDAVYLTSAYGWHFARASTQTEPGVIFEIDDSKLDLDLMHPDEDTLEQAGRKYDEIEGDIKERTLYYRKIARHNPNWQIGLDAMGTCAYYGKIQSDAIKRYAVLDWSEMDTPVSILCSDSVPSITSYRFLSDRFIALTQYLFGEDVDVSRITGIPDYDPKFEEFPEFKQRNETLRKIFKSRKGLSVVELKNGAD